MNSSSSSLLALKLETLCVTLESQKLQLIDLIETIERHKKGLETSLQVLNDCRLKEKRK